MFFFSSSWLPETVHYLKLNDIPENPTRFTFPINEQTLNENNYKEAASAIGGDKLVIKIFGDKF